MRLRPHHLLCTQTFTGSGYSDEFIANMTAVTTRLHNNPNSLIQLVCSTDQLCEHCPNMITAGQCCDDAKVKEYDRKVMAHFDLHEGHYYYRELIDMINQHMTATILEDICGGCSWYQESGCETILLGKR
ncbi:MAG: DUF1284 domain-containing protein [Lachnospiraceae bacterium]|jgi:hypothetical protein|nr:DUF1284 domain-containing protein [Lachnospiraceae bacterium]